MTTHITAAQAAELLRNATPGPWLIGRNVILTRDANGNPQRHVVEFSWPDVEVQAHADHCLIAAAPALAARVVALESALREVWSRFTNQPLCEPCDCGQLDCLSTQVRALLSPDDTRTTP